MSRFAHVRIVSLATVTYASSVFKASVASTPSIMSDTRESRGVFCGTALRMTTASTQQTRIRSSCGRNWRSAVDPLLPSRVTMFCSRPMISDDGRLAILRERLSLAGGVHGLLDVFK